MSAYIYMYDEQVVGVLLQRLGGGGYFSFNQTQNWDLVSLMRGHKGYATNCIYSGKAGSGFYINCVISIVLRTTRVCAIRKK